MSEHNEATPEVRVFPELLLFCFYFYWAFFLSISFFQLQFCQPYSEMCWTFFKPSTFAVLCKQPSCSLHYSCTLKIYSNLKWQYLDCKADQGKFPLTATVRESAVLWFCARSYTSPPLELESISNLNDRRARWIWQTNTLLVSAPFCCSATPQTPVLGLHLAMCPPPILRAGCPHLSTSTGGSWRIQNHSPRVAQHVLLTGWGAIPEASIFPGKEPACSPHYQSTNVSLLHCQNFHSTCYRAGVCSHCWWGAVHWFA